MLSVVLNCDDSGLISYLRNCAGTCTARPVPIREPLYHHLETEEAMVAYLDATLEDGDTALVVAALGDIARAKGMSQIARETGLARASLYKALSTRCYPISSTIC
jgi:probable addiction module antidote protein